MVKKVAKAVKKVAKKMEEVETKTSNIIKTDDFDRRCDLQKKGYVLKEIITGKNNKQTWVMRKA